LILGFTIQNGSGTLVDRKYGDNTVAEYIGGGIISFKANPTIHYNKIYNNGGLSDIRTGGAVYSVPNDDDVEYRDNYRDCDNDSFDYRHNFFENNTSDRIGVALAGKRISRDYKVYVLMGDGECNEGSVWEAAMAGAHYNLDNLVAILDKNNLQQTGTNREIMSVGDLVSKWKSFGWQVFEIDGHNVTEIYDTFLSLKNQNGPVAIVANTVKGKGFSFAENNNAWHHAPLSSSQYESALEELKN